MTGKETGRAGVYVFQVIAARVERRSVAKTIFFEAGEFPQVGGVINFTRGGIFL